MTEVTSSSDFYFPLDTEHSNEEFEKSLEVDNTMKSPVCIEKYIKFY